MDIVAQVVGLCAVILFLLSYQQKKRIHIILYNTISRFLYILQYVLLGAYAGAVLDILGAVSSVAAGRKHTGFIKKHTTAVMLLINACIITAGVTIAILNNSWIDLFSLVGVLLHTIAFWINNEKIIRIVSLIGTPFWLVYNFLSRAYGSALGDLLTLFSIVIAMIRHRNSADESQQSPTVE